MNAVCSDLLDEYSDQVLQVCRGLGTVLLKGLIMLRAMLG